VNYNFTEGWYLDTAPIITANWLTAGYKASKLLFGGGIKIGGTLPVNLSVAASCFALRPEFASTWQLRSR
jgi:hypothetical protein